MIYHHELILELFLLNNAVLLSHLNSSDKEIKKNKVSDKAIKKEN